MSEQYYEQDILEKCGVPVTPRSPSAVTASGAALAVKATEARTPRASSVVSPAKLPTGAAPSDDALLKLPSLKVLNLDADVLREKNNIHASYMAATLDRLAPMLRILHVFRVMNQVPELAAFYNANRLVSL